MYELFPLPHYRFPMLSNTHQYPMHIDTLDNLFLSILSVPTIFCKVGKTLPLQEMNGIFIDTSLPH